MKTISALLFMMLTGSYTEAQVAGENRQPDIVMNYMGNDVVQFSTSLPPLYQVAGAPAPFYTYFWEFGDGTFSDAVKEAKPRHRYKTSGTYQVRLLATNNYDNGKAVSKTQSFEVKISSPGSGTNGPTGFFDTKDLNRNIKLKVNRHPRAGEDLVAYLGYRNRRGDNFTGSLVIFFNDQRFLRRSFRLKEDRSYNGEEHSSLGRLVAGGLPDPEMNRNRFASVAGRNTLYPGGVAEADANPDNIYDYLPETSTVLHTVKKKYMDNAVFRFGSIPKGEERFVFLTMETKPEMIKDTNAAVTMTAMMVPDNPNLPVDIIELEMQIVASHDPNRMLLRQNPINYRFMRKKKELAYKVEFQNTGNGSAKNISVGIALPNQFNTATLQVTGVSPAPLSCAVTAPGQSCLDTVKTADSIHFFFRNIYLPGLQQKLVSHEDSTKGFVEYTIRFKKRPKKIPFSSRAVIQFDQNTPVYTNKATARFVKGFSPGIMAGYNLSLSNGNYSAKGPLQIGYVLAPYAPSRPYFQIEVHGGILQQENSTTVRYTYQTGNIYKKFTIPAFTSIDSAGPNGRGTREEIILIRKRNELQVVPLHLRYNLNDWIGLGLGVMGKIAVSDQIIQTEKDSVRLIKSRFSSVFAYDSVLTNTSRSSTTIGGSKMWAEAAWAPFIDLQVGRVRTGPTLGLRYYRLSKGEAPNRFFVYAAFKL